jgi:nucleoside-diphosphate-sugar epimerase
LQARESEKGLQASVDAMRSRESQLLAASEQGQVEAVVLRFGSIYGPQNPGTQAVLDLLRRRRMPVVRGADGLTPFVHTADAARALVAALERGRPGTIYNIADGEPGSFNEFVAGAAQAIGAPPPPAYPAWLMRLLAPAAVATARSRIPLSNARAREELGWTPEFRSYREGLAQVVQQLPSPEGVGGRALHQPS